MVKVVSDVAIFLVIGSTPYVLAWPGFAAAKRIFTRPRDTTPEFAINNSSRLSS